MTNRFIYFIICSLLLSVNVNAQNCVDDAALLNNYAQVATCVAKDPGDPVLVITNAPNQSYQTATYPISTTNNTSTIII